jgi:hypothetical protein
MRKHPLFLLIIFPLLTAASYSGSAHAARSQITKSGCASGKEQALFQASNGVGAYAHPSSVSTFQCILQGFENIGMRIAWVGGYGCRPLRTSNHPRGLAMDVNQYARDRTRPVVPRQPGVDIARKCNATSGAVWRHPDNGHFELRSASRSQQRARRASYPAYQRPRHYFFNF